jgi:TonB family protein
MRLSLGHWLLAGLLAVAFHAAILIGWRAPVSSMTATPRGPKVEMATSLAGIMGQPVEMREIKAPPELDKAKPPEEMREVEPDRPDTVTDQKPFEVAATAPVVIPREVEAAEPLPMVTPTEVPVLEAVPPTLKQVQPKKAKKTKPKELKSKPPPKEIKPKKEAKKKPVRNLRAQNATKRGTSKRGKGGRAKKVRRASSSSVRAYGRRVRGRILQRARGGGGSGTAVVSFGVSLSGGLRYARIARSSGKKYLDRRALAAVRGSYPRPPKGATSSQLRFTIAISFR